MYVVKIKKQVTRDDGRNGWEGIPAEELVGSTLLDYIRKEEVPVVAALFEEGLIMTVITNSLEYVDMYRDKCLTLMADQLYELMLPEGSSIELVAKVFPDGRVGEVRTDP